MASYILWLWAMNFLKISFCYLENGDANTQLMSISEKIMACASIWRMELSLCYAGSGESPVSLSWGLQP